MLEILAPAGNAECAKAAIVNGADAIYLGFKSFSARQSADNFTEEELSSLVKDAHLYGVKVYVAMNTLVKDGETEAFVRALLSVWALGVDAIILQDILLGKYLKSVYPELVLHLSTQAGVCTVSGAEFAKDCGFSRVILARETPIAEIKEISKIIETEAFVQGALCTAFSGQCYFSSFAGGNSGNRGRCKQPCRKRYAYDRNGNTEKNYALSLSDLCVGEDIQKYIDAGVVSFKIEGRMRRAEYVASAVRYYRALLDGGDKISTFSDLKRAYNRGNYTKGLAFGQDKRLLSTAVQGHVGEKVGVVKVVNGKYIVESLFRPRVGDAFKILRDGKEVGGAYFSGLEKRGFSVQSKVRLKNGDGVFVTTDTATTERVLSGERKKRTLDLRLVFHEGEYPIAECDSVRLTGDKRLQKAVSRPLCKEDIAMCFQKTDGLAIEPFIEVDLQSDIFVAKSELNAFRRAFYEKFVEYWSGARTEMEYSPIPVFTDFGTNDKTAVLGDRFEGVTADIAVYKPSDFNAPLPDSFINGKFEKYIYYPAFATNEDERAIARMITQARADGIYAENYGGIAFAKKEGVSLFAGTGFNLTNAVSVAELLKFSCVKYYALSKELNETEIKPLLGARSFALVCGNIKLMDLCYCPFGKTCGVCDKKNAYALCDEHGRVFPVRRYLSADGSCRFEVYNCADLIGKGLYGNGKLLDLTLVEDKKRVFEIKDDETKQKELFKNHTFGHANRGVL